MTEIEKLITDNLQWIKRKAKSYYKDDDDASDLAADTICKCLMNARLFDSHREFKPWVLTVMQNTFITAYNKRKRILFHPIDDATNIPTAEGADQRMRLKSIYATIRKCNRQSETIGCVRLFAKGYSYQEISLITSIPIGTVKSRIASGRKLIERELNR